jgi:hypothetical protein
MWVKKYSVDKKAVKNTSYSVYDIEIEYSKLKLHFKL